KPSEEKRKRTASVQDWARIRDIQTTILAPGSRRRAVHRLRDLFEEVRHLFGEVANFLALSTTHDARRCVTHIDGRAGKTKDTEGFCVCTGCLAPKAGSPRKHPARPKPFEPCRVYCAVSSRKESDDTRRKTMRKQRLLIGS